MLTKDARTIESIGERQGFFILIGNADMTTDHFYTDTISILYYRNIKKTDKLDHIISGYADWGKTIGDVEVSIKFDKNKKAIEGYVRYGLKSTVESIVKWDDNGNIITKENVSLLSEKNVDKIKLPRPDKFTSIRQDSDTSTKSFLSFKPVKLPSTNYKKTNEVFKRIEYLVSMKKPRELAQLFTWELTKKNSGGTIHCVNGKVRDIAFCTTSGGYYISFDEDGKILAYAEGSIDAMESRKFENFYNNSDKSQNMYWMFLNCFVKLGKGIEVTFHPNGYPASYRTVVRDRLFGRQIEWNDKGEVLSDVDFDIPKVWKDAPKTNEPNPK
jgi:hypothetical protein